MRTRRRRSPQRHFSMIRDFHVADFFTLANGASGTAAIFLAMEHMRDPGPGRFRRHGPDHGRDSPGPL